MSEQTPIPALTRRGPGLRRVLTAIATAPVLFGLLVWAGGGIGTSPSTSWLVMVGLAAALGSSTAASYLPATGPVRRLVRGCGPCAVSAAASVPVAALLLSSQPLAVPTATLACLVTGAGLFQRLRDPATCPTPAARPS